MNKPRYQVKTDKAGKISAVLDTSTGQYLDAKQLKKFMRAITPKKRRAQLLQKPVFNNRVEKVKKKCLKCGGSFETKSGPSGNDWCAKCHGITPKRK